MDMTKPKPTENKPLACTFCGHSDTSIEIKPALQAAIEALITDKGVTMFYVGSHGAFDFMSANILHTLKERYPHIRAYTVLAYIPGKKEEFPIKERLETLYPDGLETVPRRYAITHRNRWMILNSDYIISGVRHGWGGAAQTVKFAESKGLKIVSLYQD